MKRYCQTLTLVDDAAMIAKYVEVHAHVWPEVIAGQREVGIVDMQIYRRGRSLFMIMDTVGTTPTSCWPAGPRRASCPSVWPAFPP